MNKYLSALPSWSTSALSFNVDALSNVSNVANDASALCQHLDHCKVTNKRRFVMGRFITTLAVVFVLSAGYLLVV
jgi:hypothetical protein